MIDNTYPGATAQNTQAQAIIAAVAANTSTGGWTLYSTNSGSIAIHATPLSNGQVNFIERPGNREAIVSLRSFRLLQLVVHGRCALRVGGGCD